MDIQISKRQEAFINTTADEVLFGGAAGGGKSYGQLIDAFLYALKYPKSKQLILRRTFAELEKSLIRTAMDVFPIDVYKYNAGKHLGQFPNGSIIDFGYCDNESDVHQYQSAEYDVIRFDELTTFSEDMYKYLISRLRGANNYPKQVKSSTNPGGIGHCVPYGEVLTVDGWRNIQDVKVGEFVLTQDTANNVYFEGVTAVFEYDFDGYLLKHKSKTLEVCGTPNHKIARVTETKNKTGRVFHDYTLTTLESLSDVTRLPKVGIWQGKHIDNFTVENTEKRAKRVQQPLTISGDNYCSLMGWFLSEGCTMQDLGYFGIAQCKAKNRVIIEDLLNKCGFSYKYNSNSYVIYSRSWADYLAQFGKCRDKYIPNIIKDATVEQINLFITSALLGDGCGNHYYTTSKQLANDMYEVGIKVGYRPTLSSRQRKDRNGLSYDVNLANNRIRWVEKANTKKEKYIGKVYCVSIKNTHAFYIRQSGKLWLSGNSWVKDRFISPSPPDTEFTPKDSLATTTRIFLPSKVTDNHFLLDCDPNYINRLMNLNENDRKALLYGDWDLDEGRYFTEWNKAIHVIKPFPIPTNWRRYFAMDYGLDMLASYWIAVDEHGRAYAYKEYCESNLIISDAANAIKARTEPNEIIHQYFAPPDLWNRRQDSGKSLVELFQGAGIHLTKASNDRVQGWYNVKEWLKPTLDETGKTIANLRVFDNCTNLIDSMPNLQIDKRNPNDVSTEPHKFTHSPDAIRYFLAGRPIPNYKPIEHDEDYKDYDEQLDDFLNYGRR